MDAWHLKLLGGFELRRGGRAVDLPNRKDRLLIAYLAFNAGRPQDRGRLAGLLWADRGEEQARGSLRQSLAALRAALGDDADHMLAASREDVVLKAGAVGADALQFEAAMAGRNWELAAQLYLGQLLDGLALPSEYETWLTPERQRLEDLAARCTEEASFSNGGSNLRGTVISLCRNLLARDRLREPVYRSMMRLLAQQGDRIEALRTYSLCRDALSADLGIAPAEETEALYRELMEAADAPRAKAPARQPADGRPSIAIIPFQNISRDAELDILCEGLAEDITAGLGRFKLLSIVDRHSSSQVVKSTSDAQEIGKLLGVELVVQGSLQKQQDGLRLTVRLVDAASRAQKWSGQFGFTSADILSAPGKVMSAILPSINAKVETTLIDLSRRKPTLAAYEHLLIGIRHLRGYEPDDNRKAIEHFDLALAADPGFALALAYRGFADIVFHGYDATPRDILEASLVTIRKASVIDPEEPRIWWLMGIAHAYLRDIDAEEKCYRRSVELNPSDANALAALGLVMVARGRHEEGLATFKEAFKINPYHPEWYWVDYGSALFVCGRYEEAIEAYGNRSDPHAWVLCRLAACYAQLDRLEEARAVAAKVLLLKPDFRLSQQRPGSWGPQDAARFRAGMLKAGLPP